MFCVLFHIPSLYFLVLEQTLLVDFGIQTLDLSSAEVLTKLQEALLQCEDELRKVEESSKGSESCTVASQYFMLFF